MKKKQILIPVAVIVLVIMVTSIIIILRKNMPSKEHMELKDYFNVPEGMAKLIMQEEAVTEPGLYEDGQVYIGMDIIKDMLNPGFYWDSVENKLLYSTSSAVVSAELNSNICYTNKGKKQRIMRLLRFIMMQSMLQ